jgi:hypothetical protein
VKRSDRPDREYLWDPNAPVDPEIHRLEDALAPLAHRGGPPSWEPGEEGGDPADRVVLALPRQTASRRWLLGAAALAAALLLVAGIALWLLPRGGWQVEVLAGEPSLDGRAIPGGGRLRPGGRLETGASGRARLALDLVGEVDVEPGSELELLASRVERQRFRLAHGALQVRVWAPPQVFQVETPAVRAIDLGCVYELRVDRRGDGRLAVVSGWVALVDDGLESFVPAGAWAAIDGRGGPGVPLWDDAPAALAHTVALLAHESDSVRRSALLAEAAAAARERDALTLWHLLARASPADRAALADRLAELVPPPAAAPRTAVIAGDPAALDAWWTALELGSTAWWRLWRQPAR